MSEKVNIKQKIEEGWVRSLIIFEMAGKPKEHILKSLRNFLTKLKENKGIIVISETEHDAEFHEEEDVWSTFTEMELLVEGIEKFVQICVTFTPASIEILEPKKLTFTQKNLGDWLNELLSLLHHLGMKNKQSSSEAAHHMQNLTTLAKNTIVLALESTDTKEGIMKKTGINKEVLDGFLKILEKEKRIKKEGNKYKKSG